LTLGQALRQHGAMDQPKQAKVKLLPTVEYREGYSNSVQVRVNLWDFFLQFGTVHQTAPDEVEIRNFQGVYLSPQQAKALSNILKQNIAQYEQAFGEIKLDPNAPQSGVIN
jgi:flagellar protein FlaG